MVVVVLVRILILRTLLLFCAWWLLEGEARPKKQQFATFSKHTGVVERSGCYSAACFLARGVLVFLFVKKRKPQQAHATLRTIKPLLLLLQRALIDGPKQFVKAGSTQHPSRPG